MFEKYVPICFAVDKLKEINGRKRFQKMIFLLKTASMPFDEMFEWNNFGPFSKELAYEIDALCKMDFLNESYDGLEYQYELAKKGKGFLEKMSDQKPELYNRFEKILSVLDKHETRDLEKSASIKFLGDKGYDLDYIRVFLEYAKGYTEKEVNEGKKEVDELFKTLKNI